VVQPADHGWLAKRVSIVSRDDRAFVTTSTLGRWRPPRAFLSALMLEERSANMLGNELSPQNVIEKSRKVVIIVGVSPSAESTDAFIAGDSSECLRGLPEGTDESSAHSFRIGESDRTSNDFDRLRAFLDLKPGDLGT
jgi:hypothetical protein